MLDKLSNKLDNMFLGGVKWPMNLIIKPGPTYGLKWLELIKLWLDSVMITQIVQLGSLMLLTQEMLLNSSDKTDLEES